MPNRSLGNIKTLENIQDFSVFRLLTASGIVATSGGDTLLLLDDVVVRAFPQNDISSSWFSWPAARTNYSMRQILFGIAGLIVFASSASSAEAQVGSNDRRVSDSLALEGWRDVLDELGAQFGLAAISRPTSDTMGIELRITESLGPGMAPRLVLREVHGAWSARRLEPRLRNDSFVVDELLLAGDWRELWPLLRQLGLFELPPLGGGRRSDIQNDGHSILIELRQGKSYRWWWYRLEPPLDAPMKQMLEIARAVRAFAPS